MLGNQNQLAREVSFISRMDIYVDGIPASVHDRNQFVTVTILRYGLELDLLSGGTLCDSVYRRVIHGIHTVDLKLYAADTKLIKELYIESLALPQGLTWCDFKRRISGRIHYKWILTIVERLFSSPGKVIQWLSFDERLQTDSNQDISAEIAAYLDFEKDLECRTYDETLLTELSDIISEWFSDAVPAYTAPNCKFGPGATAELGRASAVRKAQEFNLDPSVLDLFGDIYYRDEDELAFEGGNPSYTNRIIFVPKNALKHRIISAEPTWLTWFQQILKDDLYKYVEDNPAMFSWFSNQERSRNYALLGSLDGSYATVDQSNASDSITVTMVRELFKHTPYCELLMRTRSTMAKLPDDSIVRLTKFAPMGSATCFVVLTTCMLAICELSIRRTFGRYAKSDDYVVYGDDVIIKTDAYPEFVRICEALGFEINRTKTYASRTGRVYRESCGIECIDGVDITPLRYSRFQEPVYSKAPIDPNWWASTVDLINRMQLAHYESMRSACVGLIKLSTERGDRRKRLLSARIWKSLLRVDEDDFKSGDDGPLAVITPNNTATNYHCKTRMNANLQRLECRVLTPIQKSVDHNSEPKALELWYYRSSVAEHLAGVDPNTYDVFGSDPLMQGCAGPSGRPIWVWAWVPIER